MDASRVLRIRGAGDVGLRGGDSGDVYVTFRVNMAPNFWREGLDLFSEVQPKSNIPLEESTHTCALVHIHTHTHTHTHTGWGLGYMVG